MLDNRSEATTDTMKVLILLRDTFNGKAKGHSHHIKQSGGYGQNRVCDSN